MNEVHDYNYTVSDRFLKYVTIDTQSDPSIERTPSTLKQLDLARLLVQELQEMGIEDVELDTYGYVYATIPATTDKKVPIICFCAHLDTAPDAPGKDIKPIVHTNYTGGKIILPDDKNIVIDPEEDLELRDQIGNDIITASGLTLLGGDDKAGIAEIMDMAHFFMTHPQVKHGAIKLLFTPDEEIGKGTVKVDIRKLGADFGYTVDGGEAGTVDNQTFSADGVIVNIKGVATHPGYAYGKMQNAQKIAAEILVNLHNNYPGPENTKDMEGFIHPTNTTGDLESAQIKFIVRDFDAEQLKIHEENLKSIIESTVGKYAGASYDMTITEQYRNFKEILDKTPELVNYALTGIRRTGIEPNLGAIRGGTDGSLLSRKGLPCPNLSAGEHNIHSRKEWVCVQEMQKIVESLIHTTLIREENA